MKKRTNRRKPCSNPIRPGWMLNVILLCLLLGVIGAAYVWLNDRTKKRAEINWELARDIGEIQRRIDAADKKLQSCLTDSELRALAEREARDLKDISQAPKGTVITLPPAGTARSELNPLASTGSL